MESMAKKTILVAVDGSLQSKCLVRYIGAMAAIIPDMGITLLNVQGAISQYLTEEAQKSPKINAELKRMMARHRQKSEEILNAHHEQLVVAGVDESRIQNVSHPMVTGVADDILNLAQVGQSDVIAVGRRGITYIHELLTGSVTANLIDNSRLVPLWLTSGDVKNQRILLAVDGSNTSLRAVDHLSFVLIGNPDAHVHLLHVQPTLGDCCTIDFDKRLEKEMASVVLNADQHCIDGFYANALEIFKKTGIEEKRIHVKVVKNRLMTGRTILEEARKGAFGTVVVGHRGMSKSRFMGSVSHHVIQHVKDMAVWMVP
ncbi:MAG: universal stress protein [Desulfosarcina sp.]|nr:universal stress protein [Desulfosarcina sp.]